MLVFSGESPKPCGPNLKDIHQQQKPGTRFNAYDILFSIRKDDDESLSTLVGRVSRAMQDIKALRPEKFTINQLDDELQSMALIRALPSDFDNFVSSILLLHSLSLDKLVAAFHTEETQRRSRDTASVTSFKAAAAKVQAALVVPSNAVCTWCTNPGHTENQCFSKKKAQERAVQRAQEHQTTRGGKKGKEAKAEKSSIAEETASQASIDPLSPASSNWNTDTGTSSHMSHRRDWFHVWTPHVVPIQLADNSVIYSAGMGTVVFEPKDGDGKVGEAVEFQDVLHVPDLRNNLLSPFHLTCHKGYKISIAGSSVQFFQDKVLRFSATVNDNNIGYLNGVTRILRPVTSNAASTCPLDVTLWHRRTCHRGISVVRDMHENQLVLNMKMDDTRSSLDPICEPCLMGKHRRHNIPRGPSLLPTRPLAIVFSDLKGPMPVATPEGDRYWITFICGALRFWAVALLKHKSDALAEFKRYKAYAENFHGLKILEEQDDGGGEYMGRQFDQLCIEAGISRRHTEPDEPHQNGIAERANRDCYDFIFLSKRLLSYLIFGAYLIFRSATPGEPSASYSTKAPYSRLPCICLIHLLTRYPHFSTHYRL